MIDIIMNNMVKFMKIIFKAIIIGLLLTQLCIFLSACNTVAGFGKDMQEGGQELQSAAQKQKSS